MISAAHRALAERAHRDERVHDGLPRTLLVTATSQALSALTEFPSRARRKTPAAVSGECPITRRDYGTGVAPNVPFFSRCSVCFLTDFGTFHPEGA